MCTTRLFTLATLAISITSFNAAAAPPNEDVALGKFPSWIESLADHLDFRVDPRQTDYLTQRSATNDRLVTTGAG
jgi:alanyl aminopeptidase